MALMISPVGFGQTTSKEGGWWQRAGASLYKVEGDPIVALLAQLNRFMGRPVAVGNCPPSIDWRVRPDGSMIQPFALKPEAFGDDAAKMAAELVYNRWFCVDPSDFDKSKTDVFLTLFKPKYVTKLNEKLTEVYGTPVNLLVAEPDLSKPDYTKMKSWVRNNLDQVLTTIAQVGDAADLPAAKTGIKERDKNLVPETPWWYYALGGVAALGVVGAVAAVLARKAQKEG